MEMKKILITGSTGMLGSDLIKTFSADTGYEVYGLSRTPSPLLPDNRQYHVDLAQPGVVDRIKNLPDTIVHCAAITDLSLCEENPTLADQVHVKATRDLTRRASPKARFFYISTDSVFDGTQGNYDESHPPHPLNAYALTKLGGERAAREENPKRTTIIRTNLYGFHRPLKNSLSEWAFREWKDGRKITGFSDLIFNAVYSGQLARIIKFLIDSRIYYPVLNIGSNEAISKFEFLNRFRKKLGIDQDLLTQAVSTDFPSTLPRPKDTSLRCSLLSTFLDAPTIDDGLQEWINCYNSIQYAN
jgi:dTDP-4-dehydrorhamnose reductase